MDELPIGESRARPPVARGRQNWRAPGADAAENMAPALRALAESPGSFEFYQAVRLLERAAGDTRLPVGEYGDPTREVARFGANPQIAFPPAEISAASLDGAQPKLTVNFFGLNGPSGVLPLEYSVYVLARMRAKDPTLRDFLDLFNHRLVSLLYRAWAKARVEVGYERDGDDLLTRHLRDLTGIGTAGMRDRMPISDETVLRYAALLSSESRSAIALEQLVSDYFGVPCTVEQFVGAWYPVEDFNLCRLGEKSDETTALGLGALSGDEVWEVQSRARIRVGPIPRRAYDRFLPGGPDFEDLRALTRFFSRDEIDFELQLVLAAEDVPQPVLGDSALPLGWSTWLRSRPHEPFGRDADETVFTL